MKKIIVSMLLASLVSTAFSQVSTPVSYTCHDLYVQQAKIAKTKRDNYNNTFNKKRGDGSFNDAFTIVGLMAGFATASVPVLAIGMLTPATISVIKNIPKKEERALRLEQETSRQLTRFVEKLQRKVSPLVTSEEVVSIIRTGFDSGEFCKDVSKLARPSKIRKFVKDQLKLKYSTGDVSQLIGSLNGDDCQEE